MSEFKDHKHIIRTLESMAHLCESQGRQPTEDERERAGYFISLLNETEYQGGIPEFWTRPINPPHKPNPQDMGGYVPKAKARASVPAFGPQRGRIFPECGDRGGFNSLGDYLCAVVDPRKIRAGQTIGTPSEGGFLAPEGWGWDLLDFFVEQSPILSRCWVVPMTEGSMKWPSVDDRDHSGDIAGLAGVWLGEGASMSYDTVITRQIELSANKLGILTKGTREFFQDGKNAEWFIRNVMAKAARFYLDYAFVQGTGAGQPLGLLNAPGKITVDKESPQDAATFTYQNACDMYKALPPDAEGAFWLMSPSIKTQLFTMSMFIGTGGFGYFPAIKEAEGITTLLGMPVFYTEHCSVLGTEGDVILVNPKGYLIGMRQEVIIDASPHVLFTTDETALRLIVRVDAAPVQSQKLVLKDGQTEVSDIVTLETRS